MLFPIYGEPMNQRSDRGPMKYFIVNGFLPSPHLPILSESDTGTPADVVFSRCAKETRAHRAQRYRNSGVEAPVLGETDFLNIESVGTISVFVFGVYEALFLVKAVTQQNAYVLANALRSFLVVACGFSVPADRSNYYLLELESAPDPSMTIWDLVSLVRPIPESQPLDRDWLKRELTSGPIIRHRQLREVCNMIAVGLQHPRMLEAIKHLEYSYSLFWGHMTGSYYGAHYSGERTESSEYELEKLYLEHSVRFDLALLSAFRGLEALLGTRRSLRRSRIAARLAALDSEYLTSFQTDTHECFHLIFSGKPRFWRYEEIINHFLVLRNSVAAHANIRSPRIIMEDQVYEIQRLVQHMLSDILMAATGPPP